MSSISSLTNYTFIFSLNKPPISIDNKLDDDFHFASM